MLQGAFAKLRARFWCVSCAPYTNVKLGRYAQTCLTIRCDLKKVYALCIEHEPNEPMPDKHPVAQRYLAQVSGIISVGEALVQTDHVSESGLLAFDLVRSRPRQRAEPSPPDSRERRHHPVHPGSQRRGQGAHSLRFLRHGFGHHPHAPDPHCRGALPD